MSALTPHSLLSSNDWRPFRHFRRKSPRQKRAIFRRLNNIRAFHTQSGVWCGALIPVVSMSTTDLFPQLAVLIHDWLAFRFFHEHLLIKTLEAQASRYRGALRVSRATPTRVIPAQHVQHDDISGSPDVLTTSSSPPACTVKGSRASDAEYQASWMFVVAWRRRPRSIALNRDNHHRVADVSLVRAISNSSTASLQRNAGMSPGSST